MSPQGSVMSILAVALTQRHLLNDHLAREPDHIDCADCRKRN